MNLATPELEAMLRSTPELQRAYFVGGCVRDWLLGLPVKDFDLEVFGVSWDALAGALSSGASDVGGDLAERAGDRAGHVGHHDRIIARLRKLHIGQEQRVGEGV